MMAMASPRFNCRETPSSTVSGPPGAGYCLVMPAISSMDGRVRDPAIDFNSTRGHLGDAVVLAHTLSAAAAQLPGEIAIAIEGAEGIGKCGGIIGIDQQASAGAMEQFGKGSAARLDDRHSASHGFKQEDA